MVADRALTGLVKPFILKANLVDSWRRTRQSLPGAIFILWVTACLVACQSGGVRIPMDHEFSIEGKLAIRGKSRHSARFRWSQTGEDYRIELWGPLGHGRTVLVGDARRLKVLDGGGKVLESGPVYQVMEKQLGWYLPLEALPQWVQGGPIEQLPVSAPMIDSKGRMIAFDQLGWRLGFTYTGEATAPNRIRAVRGDYQVLLVLNRPTIPGGLPTSPPESQGATSSGGARG